MSAQAILLALAGNPAPPAEQVDALVATGDPAVRRELRAHRLTAAQTGLLAAGGDREVLAALIESGNLPVERVPRDDPWALLAGGDPGRAHPVSSASTAAPAAVVLLGMRACTPRAARRFPPCVLSGVRYGPRYLP